MTWIASIAARLNDHIAAISYEINKMAMASQVR